MINDERKDNLKASLQGTGVDLVLYWGLFEDAHELFVCDEFSCILTTIDGIKSIIVMKTAMTPGDPYADKDNSILMREYADYVDEKWLKGRDDFDVYYFGVILTQTRVPESEQGVFRMGGKYSGSSSPALLIRPSKTREYGYRIENPLKLSMVSDEYYLIEHLTHNGKRTERAYRKGSYDGPNGHPADKWIVMASIGRQRYEYPIYMDPYALKPYEDAFETGVLPYGFALGKE